MSNKLIKNKQKPDRAMKPELQLWITWRNVFIVCGVVSLLLLGFVSLLPQDYEKYNIPLFFGIWFVISAFLILLGAVVVLLAKKSKKIQSWAEKELVSFAKWRLKREIKKDDSNI